MHKCQHTLHIQELAPHRKLGYWVINEYQKIANEDVPCATIRKERGFLIDQSHPQVY